MNKQFKSVVLCVIGLVALVPALSLAAPSALMWDPSGAYRELYPPDGVELGRGWHQNSGTAAPGGCVKGEPQKLTNSELSYSFTEITSREQIYKGLHLNAAVKYGALKASSSFADRYNSDRTAINVLATVDVRKFGMYWAPKSGRFEIDPAALDQLKKAAGGNDAAKAKALQEFFDRCGDSYVSAIENGANYNSQFAIAANTDSKAKLFGASVSGGFGKFKASISLNEDSSSVFTNSKNRVATSQSGGVFEVPTTSTEAYSRIKSFSASVTVDNAVPITMILRPYESHSDFPAALKGLRTSGQTVAHLAGMAERFEEIAESYRNAIFGRHAFQFPFQQVNLKSTACDKFTGPDAADRCLVEELAAEVRVADGAANCLSRIVLWCRDDAVCDVRKIPVNTYEAQCFSRAPLSEAVTKSAYLSDTIINEEQKSRFIDRLLGAFVGKADTAASSVALDVEGVAKIYLEQFASLPIVAKSALGTGGDLLSISAACALYASADDCSVEGLASLNEGQRYSSVRQGFREWILSERLGKAVGGACDVSPAHPICRAGGEAPKIAANIPLAFSPPRRFTAADNKVVAAPVVVPPPVVVIMRPSNPCGGGGGARRRCDPN